MMQIQQRQLATGYDLYADEERNLFHDADQNIDEAKIEDGSSSSSHGSVASGAGALVEEDDDADDFKDAIDIVPIRYDYLSAEDQAHYADKEEMCYVCHDEITYQNPITGLFHDLNPFAKDMRLIGHTRQPGDPNTFPERLHPLHAHCMAKLRLTEYKQHEKCSFCKAPNENKDEFPRPSLRDRTYLAARDGYYALGKKFADFHELYVYKQRGVFYQYNPATMTGAYGPAYMALFLAGLGDAALVATAGGIGAATGFGAVPLAMTAAAYTGLAAEGGIPQLTQMIRMDARFPGVRNLLVDGDNPDRVLGVMIHPPTMGIPTTTIAATSTLLVGYMGGAPAAVGTAVTSVLGIPGVMGVAGMGMFIFGDRPPDPNFYVEFAKNVAMAGVLIGIPLIQASAGSYVTYLLS